ncbi:MAG: hypothetical protein A2051_03025, partial [Desulfovibrionales bacterium GWA2_65_9]
AETVDEITISFEEEGLLVREELDKVILSRGAWTTILFKYREMDRARTDYGPVAFSVRRYKKTGGEYKQQSKFNISNGEQGRKIAEALLGWIGDQPAEAPAAPVKAAVKKPAAKKAK